MKSNLKIAWTAVFFTDFSKKKILWTISTIRRSNESTSHNAFKFCKREILFEIWYFTYLDIYDLELHSKIKRLDSTNFHFFALWILNSKKKCWQSWTCVLKTTKFEWLNYCIRNWLLAYLAISHATKTYSFCRQDMEIIKSYSTMRIIVTTMSLETLE